MSSLQLDIESELRSFFHAVLLWSSESAGVASRWLKGRNMVTCDAATLDGESPAWLVLQVRWPRGFVFECGRNRVEAQPFMDRFSTKHPHRKQFRAVLGTEFAWHRCDLIGASRGKCSPCRSAEISPRPGHPDRRDIRRGEMGTLARHRCEEHSRGTAEEHIPDTPCMPTLTPQTTPM